MNSSCDIRLAGPVLGRPAELTLYGPIFADGISAQDVRDALKSVPDSGPVVVHLNSPGGSAWEGIAIRNVLAAYPGRITINVDALAASAASVLLTAADRVAMAPAASLMIHSSATGAGGNSKQLESRIRQLQQIDQSVAELYAQRRGKKSVDEFLDMMRAETWLDADEAIRVGLADERLPLRSRPAMAFDAAAFATFRHPPLSVVMRAPAGFQFAQPTQCASVVASATNSVTPHAASPLMHAGKLYEQLKPFEKADLAASDPALFAAMRADSQHRAKHAPKVMPSASPSIPAVNDDELLWCGVPYEMLAPKSKEKLYLENRPMFLRMQSDWLERKRQGAPL